LRATRHAWRTNKKAAQTGGFFVKLVFLRCQDYGPFVITLTRGHKFKLLVAPWAVEVTVLVNALEAVRAEKVALTLNDIGSTLRLRKAVEVA